MLHTLGLDVAPVPVDVEGIVVDAIPAETRAVLVTPSHQFPLGHTMSLRRRVALLRWADAHDGAIIEDDYDSEFRFAGRPIEPLQNLDTSGRVLYTGSFSKTMLPSLRLGFVVVPASLRPAMHAAKYVTDWSSSTPQQLALAELIDRGWFARHLRAMRALYRERHRLISTLLDEQFTGVAPRGAVRCRAAPQRRRRRDERRRVHGRRPRCRGPRRGRLLARARSACWSRGSAAW